MSDIDSVPSCGQENDYRKAAPQMSEQQGPGWVERTDEEQIEALNHRVVELLRENDALRKQLVKVRADTIEECATAADTSAEWFAAHQSFLAEDACDDCARKIRKLAQTDDLQTPAKTIG